MRFAPLLVRAVRGPPTMVVMPIASQMGGAVVMTIAGHMGGAIVGSKRELLEIRKAASVGGLFRFNPDGQCRLLA